MASASASTEAAPAARAASRAQEAIAEQLPTPEEALEPVADSADPVARIAAATEFLLRHVLSRQGVVRALIAATITRPSQEQARPGLRFGVIDSALDPLNDTLGATDPAATAQLKRDLAVVVSAEALFSLIDLHGLDPEEAIASIINTAPTLTRALAVSRGPRLPGPREIAPSASAAAVPRR